MTLLAIFIGLVFLYSLVSARLEKTILTAPILFTAAGMLVLLLLPELRERKGNLEVFLRVAEVGLVLLLFTDASRTDLQVLKRIRNLPVRLLSTGMLLTILLGALAALAVFRQLTIWEAGILAAILAPTDAGLGQIIVNSPRVPMRIRQALNVEAGLNDGLSVPFLLFFIALAGAGAASHDASLSRFIVEQLGYGAIIGVGHRPGRRLAAGAGASAGNGSPNRSTSLAWSRCRCCACSPPKLWARACSSPRSWPGWRCRWGSRKPASTASSSPKNGANCSTFPCSSSSACWSARAWQQFDLTHVLYAVLSLTVVRMLPVAVALIGTRLSRATVLFMGWFGPRGLASIVLGLVYLEHGMHQSGAPNHPARRDGDCPAQHFRPRPERHARHQPVCR